MGHRYEIARNGVVLCSSSIPYCGYRPRLVRQMILDGYVYLVDGKERKA